MKHSKSILEARSLQAKTFLLLFSTAAVLITALVGISHATTLHSFEALEQRKAEEDLSRVSGTFSERAAAMSVKAAEWACRDDTVRFISDRDLARVSYNLGENTLSMLDINLVAFVTSSRTVAYAEFFDLQTKTRTPLPETAAEELAASPAGFNGSADSSHAGLWMLDCRPMIIASRPITAGNGQGQVYGSVIFGRLVDSDLVDTLGKALNMSLAIENFSGGQVQTQRDAPVQLTSQSPYFVVPSSATAMTGYVLLKDMLERPSLVLRAEIPRAIYAKGSNAVLEFNLLQVLAVLFVCGVVCVLVQFLVVRRLAGLSKEVSLIGASRNFEKRLTSAPDAGRDEISNLAGNINIMLSELQQSQQELKKAHDLLESRVRERTTELISQKDLVDGILKALPEAVVLLDQNDRVLQANDCFCSLFDLGARDSYGKGLNDLIDHEYLDRAVFEATMNSNPTHRVEFRYRLRDQDRVFHANVIPMPGRRALVILDDVTEEYERQERLYLTDRLASIGEMAAGLAHELNNPLTGVLGLSQLAMEGDLPEGVRQNLEDISREAQRAAAIVRNLLSFARRRETTRQVTQLNRIVQDVLGLREYEHRINNINVEAHLDPALPELLLDQFQMQQAVLNLVLNAGSAMAESHRGGNLTVTTEADSEHVRVRFADDGPGIPPELLNRIFDPFFTTKDVGKGTGLGLSVCYGIVTAHGGSISVDGARTDGATFTIELPLKRVLMDERSKEVAHVC